jgi:hypothetical protein
MSIRRLVFWITMLAVFAMAARISVDTDTWWHLRAGKWIIENKAILSKDIFSYTRYGQPWQYPGWIVEAPMYAIYQVFGLGGLNLWTAGMVTLAFAFLWRALSGGVFLRAFMTVAAAAASGVYWAARPYLITFVLAALFLWLLEDFRWRQKDRLMLLPVLMVLWANSHGGFLVGFLLWGVYAADAAWELVPALVKRYKPQMMFYKSQAASGLKPLKRLIFIGLLLVVGACLTSLGPQLLLYPFETVGIGALRAYIQEWQSPDFHNLSVQPFAWLLLLTLGVAGASRRRLALSDFLLAAGFAYMGLLAGRNVALFALAAPLVITRHAEPALSLVNRWLGLRQASPSAPTKLQKWVNAFLLILLMAAAFIKGISIYPESVNWQALGKFLPVSAVEFISEDEPAGRLFNSYNWGGYLIWALPQHPVFIDGRTDLYNDEIISQWLKVARAETDWQNLLESYQVGVILIENGSTLDRVLALTPDWREVFRDELAVVYYRR